MMVSVMNKNLYTVGQKVLLSPNITVQIISDDQLNFCGVAHYGINTFTTKTGTPTESSTGWIPCHMLDSLNGVVL